ncbi:dienelactone hydrolase [Dehalococcoides sp. THU3]|uniref:alpha/beta hydrolase family protein n=1 Tax=Dehalococcoides TaxID=61434 RepID=UPI00062D509A|nr:MULTISPECIES: dienelactone hydrolase [Dehalococcoides]QYY57747.1 dienelactone hydrolase [Dehalococcoides mccartyi]
MIRNITISQTSKTIFRWGMVLAGIALLGLPMIISAAIVPYVDSSLVAKYQVGNTQGQITCYQAGKDPEVLEISIWYPTSGEGNFSYEGFSGTLADFSGGPYPLVIFNHGLNANDIDPLYLKESLVGQGYVVASVQFNDMSSISFSDYLSTTPRTDWDNRTDNLFSAVDNFFRDNYLNYLENFRINQSRSSLDYVLNMNKNPSSPFYGLIDTEKIGMAGHSLGGLTTLALSGAHPNPAVADSRIKAIILLATPAYPFENNLANVTIPVMVMRGDYDLMMTSAEDNLWVTAQGLKPPKFFLVVSQSHHFTFSQSPYDISDSLPHVNHDARLEVIMIYSLAFMDYYLKGDANALNVLESQDPMLAQYYYELG